MACHLHPILFTWDAVTTLVTAKLIFKVPTTTPGILPGHILTNLIIIALLDANYKLLDANYRCIIGCQCRQEAGKIPNYMDREQLKTPKTDYLLTD